MNKRIAKKQLKKKQAAANRQYLENPYEGEDKWWEATKQTSTGLFEALVGSMMPPCRECGHLAGSHARGCPEGY